MRAGSLFRFIRVGLFVVISAFIHARVNAANYAVLFDGANDYVTFGAAPQLGAGTFTIEAWFKRTGAGLSTSTGSGGVDAIPLLAKGRAEADGTTQDMNYFLGIRAADGVLVADFEEGAGGTSPGLNHPVAGTTPAPMNVWNHAAATYDGSTWRLYLNGALDGQVVVGQPPRADSIQHASLGSALNSTGAAAGFFAGAIDEARIWNYARTAQDIAGNKNLEIASAPGLIGRWGLNEGSGTIATDSSGDGVNGTLVNGPTWTSGFGTNAAQMPTLTRGPYLQLGTPTSVVVRWRTDISTVGRVSYGPAPGSLSSTVDEASATTEHIVTVSGLLPDTLYYYAVGDANVTLAGNDPNFFFATAPRPGSAVPTRIWVLGDSGTQTAGQYGVRDAFYSFTGTRHPDLWLMLGDNAYNSGTDAEYQGAVFNAYPSTLRNSVLWPTLGNHDTAQATSFVDTYPYFQIFTLPKNGEAGGTPSGTEHYYSFDFGNIHFVCLDSMTANRATNGAMANWLRSDLANNVSDWLIAFWHHPPYTKGSHDSDVETELIEMRQNFLPILEAHGLDLMLSGHSHSYERSFLLDGQYGLSSTLNSTNIIDGGSGRLPAPYQKPAGNVPRQGAIYAVAGSSGQTSGGALNHPVMYVSLNVLGSLVVDVLTNQMNVTFLNNSAVAQDTFSIVKSGSVSTAPLAPSGLTASAISSSQINLAWQDNSSDENGFELERSTDNVTFGLIATLGANTTAFSDTGLQKNRRYYYRVRAFNGDGSSAYSNVVSAKTRAH